MAITQHNIYIRDISKQPVPTGPEFGKILQLLPDGHPHKLALCLIGLAGLRPSEVASLRWPHIIRGPDGDPIGIKHLIYKPKSMINLQSVSTFYKYIYKPIYSDFLKQQLILWHGRSPEYSSREIFNFHTNDIFNKLFSRWRQMCKNRGHNEHRRPGQRKKPELGPEYDFLLDKTLEPISNTSRTQYRISPYSLRRFILSFLYWAPRYFNQDGKSLIQEYSGHTKLETFYDHYLCTKRAIGYNGEDLTVDQFVMAIGQNQTMVVDWIKDDAPEKWLVPGQSTLIDF